MHVLWVCLNYGFLMSAPLLRLEWGLFGAFGVGETLEEVSPQSAIHIVVVSTTLAVVGGLHLADRIRPNVVVLGSPGGPTSDAGWTLPRPIVWGSVAVGAGALAVIAGRYLEHGSAATTHLAWYAVPVLVLLGVVEVLRRRALGAGRRELAEDHLVLLCWLVLSPVIALGVAEVARTWLDLDPPVVDATGVTLCGGLAVFLAVQTMHARIEVAGHRQHRDTTPDSRSRETSAAS